MSHITPADREAMIKEFEAINTDEQAKAQTKKALRMVGEQAVCAGGALIACVALSVYTYKGVGKGFGHLINTYIKRPEAAPAAQEPAAS